MKVCRARCRGTYLSAGQPDCAPLHRISPSWGTYCACSVRDRLCYEVPGAAKHTQVFESSVLCVGSRCECDWRMHHCRKYDRGDHKGPPTAWDPSHARAPLKAVCGRPAAVWPLCMLVAWSTIAAARLRADSMLPELPHVLLSCALSRTVSEPSSEQRKQYMLYWTCTTGILRLHPKEVMLLWGLTDICNYVCRQIATLQRCAKPCVTQPPATYRLCF